MKVQDYPELGYIAVNTGTISAATLASGFIDNSVLFVVLTALMIADFILGIMASHALNEEVTSKKMKLGLMTKLAGLIFLSCTILLIKSFYYIQADAWLIWLFWFFSAAEFISIISNYRTIRTGERQPEFEIISIFLGRLRKVLAELFGINPKDEK